MSTPLSPAEAAEIKRIWWVPVLRGVFLLILGLFAFAAGVLLVVGGFAAKSQANKAVTS